MATKQEAHDALDAVVGPVNELFGGDDPEKVGQLTSAVATARMVIEQLYDRAEVRSAEQGE
jgi:hypothetical protein